MRSEKARCSDHTSFEKIKRVLEQNPLDIVLTIQNDHTSNIPTIIIFVGGLGGAKRQKSKNAGKAQVLTFKSLFEALNTSEK